MGVPAHQHPLRVMTCTFCLSYFMYFIAIYMTQFDIANNRHACRGHACCGHACCGVIVASHI